MIENNKKPVCPICNSVETEIKSISGTNIVHCLNCDLNYLSDIPSKTFLDEYYKINYKLSSAEILGIEKRRLSRISEQIQLVSKIIKYKAPPASILDIGCDKGYFLDEARRYGYNVTGVELSAEARSYCSNTGIMTVKSLDELTEKYDIVTMWHSLEHLPQPKEYLMFLNEKMNNQGLILIRVPAYDCFWSKLLSHRWVWFQPENHYFHYSEKSLSYLIESASFKLINIGKRRPNNRFTSEMFKYSNNIYKDSFNVKTSVKKKISSVYQRITGIEIFAIAKKEA